MVGKVISQQIRVFARSKRQSNSNYIISCSEGFYDFCIGKVRKSSDYVFNDVMKVILQSKIVQASFHVFIVDYVITSTNFIVDKNVSYQLVRPRFEISAHKLKLPVPVIDHIPQRRCFALCLPFLTSF